jgi:hypothetical protein
MFSSGGTQFSLGFRWHQEIVGIMHSQLSHAKTLGESRRFVKASTLSALTRFPP